MTVEQRRGRDGLQPEAMTIHRHRYRKGIPREAELGRNLGRPGASYRLIVRQSKRSRNRPKTVLLSNATRRMNRASSREMEDIDGPSPHCDSGVELRDAGCRADERRS